MSLATCEQSFIRLTNSVPGPFVSFQSWKESNRTTTEQAYDNSQKVKDCSGIKQYPRCFWDPSLRFGMTMLAVFRDPSSLRSVGMTALWFTPSLSFRMYMRNLSLRCSFSRSLVASLCRDDNLMVYTLFVIPNVYEESLCSRVLEIPRRFALSGWQPYG